MFNNLTNNEAIGVYTPQSQLIMSESKLYELGFSHDEIRTLQYVMSGGGAVTTRDLQNLGLDYEYSKRIRYLRDVATGKVTVETKDELVKHLRRLFGKRRRIGIHDLAVSTIKNVPRWAVVAGIQDPVYSILNSSNYPVDKRMYLIRDVSSRITVRTRNKIVMKYGYPKKIDGVLEILGIDKKTGETIIAFDKKYSRVCNRYIVLASLRRPEFHHGLIEIICIEGTRVYVYVQNMGTTARVNYKGGTTRVYDYGYMPNQIKPKLTKVASDIYQRVCGVTAYKHEPNSDFTLIPESDNNRLEVIE